MAFMVCNPFPRLLSLTAVQRYLPIAQDLKLASPMLNLETLGDRFSLAASNAGLLDRVFQRFILQVIKGIMLNLILVLACITLGVTLDIGETPSQAIAAPSSVSMDETLPARTLISRLPPGNAITDGKALLRYALPIDNPTIRDLQSELEDIAETLRVQGSRRVGAVNRNITRAKKVLAQADKILDDIPEVRKAEAEALIASLKSDLEDLQAAVDDRDKERVWIKRGEMLDSVGQIEEMMVTEYPFDVPEQYSDLPQLLGRATIELKTNKGPLSVVVDGYNAPVTAGNFVDLVQRGFYDGLEIIRAEDFYVVQTGDPPGPDTGFIDPDTGEYRAIPFEIMVQGYDEPLYGQTMEAAGLYLEEPVLPFSAYGTVAMARPGDEPNGASSQFFFLKFEPGLTPAGLNLLDGRYAVFGYLTEGKEVLDDLDVGDRIVSAEVIQGLENLIEP